MCDRSDVNAVELRGLVKAALFPKVLVEPHFQAGCTRRYKYPMHVQTVIHIAKVAFMLFGGRPIWKERAARQQIQILGRVGRSYHPRHQLAVDRSDFPVHLCDLGVLFPAELIEHECKQIFVPTVGDVLVNPRSKPVNDLVSMVEIEIIWTK
jgi:hypothetical protein